MLSSHGEDDDEEKLDARFTVEELSYGSTVAA